MFASLVRDSEIFELVTRPSLALSVFRLRSDQHGDDLNVRNTLNRAFWTRLSERRELFLTQTVLNDVFCIRFAVGAARTTEEHVRGAFKILREEGEATLGEAARIEKGV